MRLSVRLLLAAIAGAGVGLSFEPVRWVVLLPFAVALLTAACRGTSVRAGALVGWVFGLVFMLVLLPWLQVIGVYAWILLAAVEALGYAVVGLVTAATARLPGWPVWAASSWVLGELLRSTVPFGGFPWGRLSFAVVDTPVAPAFAYVGAPGTTFLVALVGTTLAWAVPAVRRTALRALAGVAAVVVLAVSAAAFPFRAVLPNADYPALHVAAVQGNVPGEGLDAFSERRAVLDNHVAATLRLAGQVRAGEAPRPDLVIWPENSSDIDPYADADARRAIGGAARAIGAPLLMGAVVGDRLHRERWYNRAILWSSAGAPVAAYDKIHPVPFGEYIPLRSLLAPRVPALDQIPADMVPGTRTGVLEAAGTRVGILMCFEVAYDGLLHDLVDDGARLVTVPTNNATYTGTGQIEQQFAMSRLRAIETGRYVVVASTNGISGVIGPDGEVLARAPERATAVLSEQVLLLSARTPAVTLSAALEMALAAIAAIAGTTGLVLGYRRGRRTAR